MFKPPIFQLLVQPDILTLSSVPVWGPSVSVLVMVHGQLYEIDFCHQTLKKSDLFQTNLYICM